MLTGSIALCGVVLNAVVPGKAFEIVLNISSLGVITAWAAIVLCQLQLWRWSRKGIVERPAFRLPGSPYTGIATLAFLATVVALMAVSEDHTQRWTVATLVVIIPALVAGRYRTRKTAPGVGIEYAGKGPRRT